MTSYAFTRSTHEASVVLSVAVAVVVLSGCGGGSPTAERPPVTVTVTPTVTAIVTPPPATKTATATTAVGVARSDVVGRKFDLGTIVSIADEGGVPVIIFDRWTARGVTDSTLAASGVPIGVHSDAPYQNLNTKVTYRIPVLRGAVFTYRHCVAVDQPVSQRASTLREFASLQGPEKVVLLTLDPQGQVFSAQNDPAC